MLFNSFPFFVFFAVLAVLYFAAPFRWRNVLLLVASYIFYMCWRWEYGFLILAITLANYGCALAMDQCTSRGFRRFWLTVAIVISTGVLGAFKYLNFLTATWQEVSAWMGGSYHHVWVDIILPVGISFYTLQALGYAIDVYRREIPAERRFCRFALYVSFFPQLVAGPIERAKDLLGQFDRENRFDADRAVGAAKLILWGLFKKVVIADRLALYVNQIYGAPEDYSGATLLLATYCFAFQIYCDFSGYTDMAIGIARFLGYDLRQNFRLPYFARSIPEFWSRWHISLSTWFRDYLYLPLGGSRCSTWRWMFNISIVFLVSGLWHGAAWTFVVWGALHALFYLGARLVGRMAAWREWDQHPILAGVQIVLTFHLVCFCWVFFRAATLSDALRIVGTIGRDLSGTLYLGSSSVSTALGLAFLVILLAVQVLQARGRVPLYWSSCAPWPPAARWAAYFGLVFSILMFSVSGNEFIYFQF